MKQNERWTQFNVELPSPSIPPPVQDEVQEPIDTSSSLANRARLLVTLFLVLLLLVAARVTYWQVGPAMADTLPAPEVTPVPRGNIVDGGGLLLAADEPRGTVYTNPPEVLKHKLRETYAVSVTLALGIAPSEIERILNNEASTTIITGDATGDQCDYIKALGQPGLFWCDQRRSRAYPQDSLAAQLIGFTNYKHEGVYGVESSYDPWLRADGPWQLQRTQPGEPLPDGWKRYLPSEVGRDLVLNMDAPLQYMVERRLRDGIATYKAQSGTIIIMDPRTGAVLALANYPSFDLNHYSDVSSKDLWINSAVSDIWEPGSVLKLVTMAAGIDAGQITPDTHFYDDGTEEVANKIIRNAEGKRYGDITVREALAKSVNVVSAQVSKKLGSDTFYRYVRGFGFGRVTEIDMKTETEGIVKTPASAYWSLFDLAANSFGQGISVSSIQMIDSVAALANKGTLMQPQVARGFVYDEHFHPLAPRSRGQAIRPDTARKLTEMMVYTVESSSNHTPVPGFRVAGKTGTAEIPTKEGYTSQDVITTFVGFLPAADPQLAFLVKLDKPQRGRWAEQVALPVFAEVARDAVQILQIRPDDRMP